MRGELKITVSLPDDTLSERRLAARRIHGIVRKWSSGEETAQPGQPRSGTMGALNHEYSVRWEMVAQ